ncbi:MAG: pantoate--beta-alanine ligase, partial [Bdellovibrionaceae bacterium]|nr:pantoate--beta-alanine ligase [Pseudobdellovibrionaceae bacterium]
MSKPLVLKSIVEYDAFRKKLAGSIGFVPTMGALHPGHASLLNQSAAENDFTVLSIFVNPTQFNDPKDLENYPRTFEADLAVAAESRVAAIFYPDYKEIFSDNYRYVITEKSFSQILCGASRPGHFDGVLSVVMKLLNIVKPSKAYFGEKDFQQLRLIEDMAKAFFMSLEIRRGKTLRETSGLAMSSRNTRLSAGGRDQAALIYKTISTANSATDAKNILNE